MRVDFFDTPPFQGLAEHLYFFYSLLKSLPYGENPILEQDLLKEYQPRAGIGHTSESQVRLYCIYARRVRRKSKEV